MPLGLFLFTSGLLVGAVLGWVYEHIANMDREGEMHKELDKAVELAEDAARMARLFKASK
jgi:hypothetical protein